MKRKIRLEFEGEIENEVLSEIFEKLTFSSDNNIIRIAPIKDEK